jgi:hypothetical protein
MKMFYCIFIVFIGLISCNSENKTIEQSIYGYGPIKKLNLDPINDSVMKFGLKTFNSKCTSCHTMEYKNSGPDLSDILSRRQPEWVMNYLLNHQEMLAKDSIAIKTNIKFENDCNLNSINQDEAYAILEYFRIYQIWLHEFNTK